MVLGEATAMVSPCHLLLSPVLPGGRDVGAVPGGQGGLRGLLQPRSGVHHSGLLDIRMIAVCRAIQGNIGPRIWHYGGRTDGMWLAKTPVGPRLWDPCRGRRTTHSSDYTQLGSVPILYTTPCGGVMNPRQVEALLYQALETELGGEQIYTAALKAATHKDLVKEWTEYLSQTREHQQHLLGVFRALGLDAKAAHPSRELIKAKGELMVSGILRAIELLDADAAQIFAGECVTEAETKDHLNWSLLDHVSKHGSSPYKLALAEPVSKVLIEEAHHLFHTQGWTRELWLKNLGFPAALPPPEEVKSVDTQIGAGRAEQQRDRYT